jgi:ATP-dependent DNA ligase
MHALAAQNIPVGDEWLHEVKFDGYRFSPAEIKMPSRFSG